MLHIDHMGDLPFIEKLPLNASHSCGDMKIRPLTTEKGHHLLRHVQKILHFHIYILCNTIFFILFFITLTRWLQAFTLQKINADFSISGL